MSKGRFIILNGIKKGVELAIGLVVCDFTLRGLDKMSNMLVSSIEAKENKDEPKVEEQTEEEIKVVVKPKRGRKPKSVDL